LVTDRTDAPADDAVQDDLFSGARWIVRTTSSGTIVRLKVTPAGPGTVTIERFERRRADEKEFRRRPEEERRVVALSSVAPDHDFDALFGVATLR
jgi:hypothetical protein